MCDYSLCGLPTRLAVEGEELAVHRFRTGSVGLASWAELSTTKQFSGGGPFQGLWEFLKSLWTGPPDLRIAAICIPPGAHLVLKGIPDDLQRRWNVRGEEDVIFVQTSAEVNNYRDGVRFRDGLEILLQGLRQGIKVQVLSLGNASAGSEKDSAVPVL
jgi:hypothetical protein